MMSFPVHEKLMEQKGKTITHRGFPCGHPQETNSAHKCLTSACRGERVCSLSCDGIVFNCVAMISIYHRAPLAVSSWYSRHRTHRSGGGLVRAETAAHCVVVACWDAVLRAGRGLERVEHRCGPSPGTCARDAQKLPGAGGEAETSNRYNTPV
jgi:hypothetical protein